MKLALYISKENYDTISDFVVARIVRLVNKKDKTDTDLEELAELNKARKEINEWAAAHNDSVLDEMSAKAKEAGK